MRIKFAILVALIAALAWLSSTPVLRATGAFLVVDEAPRRADAIVVLSGSVPDRILEAVDLYQEGWAPLIVLCGEPENEGMRRLRERGVVLHGNDDVNASIARQLGVPGSAITVVERPPGSTFTEAIAILDGLAERGARSMLLVTSPYHTRRARSIYRHLAGGAVEVISRPARAGGFDPDRWWQDRVMLRRVLIEYQKLLMFQLWDRWKLAPRLQSPSPAPAHG